MKTEHYFVCEKDRLFCNAHSMHDCSFTAAYESDSLVLFFDHLEQYRDITNSFMLFDGYKQLRIIYHNVRNFELELKFGKKEMFFCNTVAPLLDKKLIMFKFSVDSFDQLSLHFSAFIKHRIWGCKIEMQLSEIEYIWE